MEAKIIPIHLTTTPSTQTYAKTHCSKWNGDLFYRITADKQTAGRGQRGRSWHSPRGVNLYLTYFFTLPKEERERIANLAQILTFSIAEVLTNEGISPQMKWPNDLLVKGKKIAGALCELIDRKERWGVLCGAGVNINMEEEACNAIDQCATSLLLETGKSRARAPLLPQIDARFLLHLSQYRKKGFAPFAVRCNAQLYCLGKKISVNAEKSPIEGTLLGLKPKNE